MYATCLARDLRVVQRPRLP